MDGDAGYKATMLLCGVPILLAGVAGSAAALTGAGHGTERLVAGGVGAMGLVFGTGFLSLLLPERWHVAGRLWRWLGWAPAAALLPFGLLLIVEAQYVADTATRVHSPVASVLRGVGVLVMAALLGRSWWTTAVRRDR